MSGQAKRTPGPWLVDGSLVYALNEEGANRFSAQVQGGHVCSTERTSGGEREANARLIAKAPELLARLKIAVGVIEASGIVWMGLDAAKQTIADAQP